MLQAAKSKRSFNRRCSLILEKKTAQDTSRREHYLDPVVRVFLSTAVRQAPLVSVKSQSRERQVEGSTHAKGGTLKVYSRHASTATIIFNKEEEERIHHDFGFDCSPKRILDATLTSSSRLRTHQRDTGRRSKVSASRRLLEGFSNYSYSFRLFT